MEETPKTIYIRVKNVYLPKSAATPPDTRTLLCHLLPQEDGCIAPLLGSGVLTTTATWIYHFTDASSTYIGFLLKDFIQNQEYEIARLVLPISWYPVDKIVTLQFPMTPTNKALAPVHITLEIHVASAGNPAFQAPVGRLLLTPRWQQVPIPATGTQEAPKPKPQTNVQNQSPRQNPPPQQPQFTQQPPKIQQVQQTPPSAYQQPKQASQYQTMNQQVSSIPQITQTQPQQIPRQTQNQAQPQQISQAQYGIPQIQQMQPGQQIQPGIPGMSGAQSYVFQPMPQQIPQNAYIQKDPADQQQMQYGGPVQYVQVSQSDQTQGPYAYMPTQYSDQ